MIAVQTVSKTMICLSADPKTPYQSPLMCLTSTPMLRFEAHMESAKLQWTQKFGPKKAPPCRQGELIPPACTAGL